jgi:PAS domain S-box-containing protein
MDLGETQRWNFLELVRRAFECVPDAMILVDPLGVICFANDQFRALFGYSPVEVVGWPVERLMPESSRSRHLAHRRDYSNAPRVRTMGEGSALSARRRDGTEFPVEISLSPIRDGDWLFIAAAIRDVTNRQRLQGELVDARQAAVLAQEAADRAGRALTQKEDTIAAMSRLLNARLDGPSTG